MINVKQSLDALSQIVGISDIYETPETFLMSYKNFKCYVTFKNNIITIRLNSNNCDFVRSWSLEKQENEASFIEDVKFFLKDTERKIA